MLYVYSTLYIDCIQYILYSAVRSRHITTLYIKYIICTHELSVLHFLFYFILFQKIKKLKKISQHALKICNNWSITWNDMIIFYSMYNIIISFTVSVCASSFNLVWIKYYSLFAEYILQVYSFYIFVRSFCCIQFNS